MFEVILQWKYFL